MTLLKMRKQKLKGNEKLRVVYGNAASALTVQFNDLKTKRGELWSCTNRTSPFDLGVPTATGRKPP